MAASNKNTIIFIIILVLYIFFFNRVFSESYREQLPVGLQNYCLLEERYTKWHEGLFGSRKYHESFLKEFLNALIDNEIETYSNFILVSPEGMMGKKVVCKFQFCRWLYIYGKIDKESIKDITTKDPNILKKLWRSKVLFAVSGKVRRARISRDKFGDTVELFLYKIKIKNIINSN